MLQSSQKPFGAFNANIPLERTIPVSPEKPDHAFINFAGLPEEIVEVMDQGFDAADVFDEKSRRVRRIALLIALAGIILTVFGFSIPSAWLPTIRFLAIFSGIGLTLIGLVGTYFSFAPAHNITEFDDKFAAARNVLSVLQDDVQQRGNVEGWLDSTGWNTSSKLTRQKTSPSGRPVHYYTDEWLRLKLKLVDSNVARVSAVDKVKSRRGFYKRSMSGKQKWKPGSDLSAHKLRIGLSVNPSLYQIDPINHHGLIPQTKLRVDSLNVENNRIQLKASADAPVKSKEVIGALSYLYNHLTRIR